MAISRILTALCVLGLMVAVTQARPHNGFQGHRKGRILKDLTCDTTGVGVPPEPCQQGGCNLGPLQCNDATGALVKSFKFCDVQNENGTSLVVSCG